MNLIASLFLVVLLFLISGCATSMKGSINSTPDPTYVFDKTVPVLVTVTQKSENALQSKHYIYRVASSLKSKGFTEVYTDKDNLNGKNIIRLIFFVEVGKRTSSYTYQGADYGSIQSGSRTYCNTYAYGSMGTANCTTTPTTSYGVVGYSDKTGYTTGHFFTLSAYDFRSKQKVLSLMTSSFNSRCADSKLYDFLAEQALSRMSFQQIVQYDFRVKMPDGYTCK